MAAVISTNTKTAVAKCQVAVDKKRAKLYSEISEDAFVNRLLRSIAKSGKSPSTNQDEVNPVTQKIRGFLDDIKNTTKDSDETIRFDASLVPTGSRVEGTSTSPDSDYDFLVVLKTFDLFGNSKPGFHEGKQMLVQLEVPKRLTSSAIDAAAPKYVSYYRLSPPAQRDHNLGSGMSRETRTASASGAIHFDSKDFLSTFKEKLKAVVTDDCQLEGKGPAVSIYLQANGQLTKVDLSLAIEVTRESIPTDPDIRKSTDGNIEKIARAAYKEIFSVSRQNEKYYFIASGEWWKLSVCAQELQYFVDLENENHVTKDVYKGLKVRVS